MTMGSKTYQNTACAHTHQELMDKREKPLLRLAHSHISRTNELWAKNSRVPEKPIYQLSHIRLSTYKIPSQAEDTEEKTGSFVHGVMDQTCKCESVRGERRRAVRVGYARCRVSPWRLSSPWSSESEPEMKIKQRQVIWDVPVQRLRVRGRDVKAVLCCTHLGLRKPSQTGIG